MIKVFVFTFVMSFSLHVSADRWHTLTWDNDMFVGQDDGYTNGLYYGTHEVGLNGNGPAPGVFLEPFSSLIQKDVPLFTVNSYTFGHTMVTPENITRKTPNENDIPYSGLLFLNNSYIHGRENVADLYGVIIGIIGPLSGGERTQKWIHKITGSEEPQGWDYQLGNELVFQLERARVWRRWITPKSKAADAIFFVDLDVGTIETAISTSAFFRFGRDMSYTYVTPALKGTRTSNPISIDGGWFIYSGITARYLARQIFIDGNTFRDSVSAELDHTQLSLSMGATYSWENCSLSFAVENSHVFEANPEAVSRYGSLTFAWKY